MQKLHLKRVLVVVLLLAVLLISMAPMALAKGGGAKCNGPGNDRCGNSVISVSGGGGGGGGSCKALIGCIGVDIL